jgi:hypothetical protein
MVTAQEIKPEMKVVDTQGKHIGTVDHIEDDIVGLTREGFADDLHHFVSLAAVMKIDGTSVVVEPGQATTIEAVAGAIRYARRQSPVGEALFGTSGHGTGDGGSGIG